MSGFLLKNFAVSNKFCNFVPDLCIRTKLTEQDK